MRARHAAVVDDDAPSRYLTSALLEAAGFVVHAAANVAEGRRLLADLTALRPAVALLDIEMPDGSGIDLQHELRARAGGAALPIIAMTALAMSGDRERLLACGFDGYIAKPLDARRFAAEVEAVIAMKQGEKP